MNVNTLLNITTYWFVIINWFVIIINILVDIIYLLREVAYNFLGEAVASVASMVATPMITWDTVKTEIDHDLTYKKE